jgi:hypothetical protein
VAVLAQGNLALNSRPMLNTSSRDIFPTAQALSDAELLAVIHAGHRGTHDDPWDGQ